MSVTPFRADVAETASVEINRIAALGEIAQKLRRAPDAEETLVGVIEKACACTGADAGMLTLHTPALRQVVAGSALGAGPHISVPLQASGPTFGELVLTRMHGAAEFTREDESFALLVSDYVAKAVAGLREGTVLQRSEQDFIDRISEEMREPMASASGLIEVLMREEAGPLTTEQRTYLESVAKRLARGRSMLDDLIMLAHLRPPELRHMQQIAVTPWLDRAVRDRRHEASAAELTLELSRPDEVFMVRGVPEQLETVMHHLLDNAIKFSKPGGRIDVGASQTEGLVSVVVADQGIGFDAADAGRMTDCFARATNAEQSRIPGAGVGLYLVKEIVDAHGGRVWLESGREAGTRAYVGLPPA